MLAPQPASVRTRIASRQIVRIATIYEANPYRLNLHVRLLGGGASGLTPKVCVQPKDTVLGEISPEADLPNCLFP